MDVNKMKKPEHLEEDTWRQHLDWMNVMGRQVEQNFNRHQERVREDADRTSALEDLHQKALESERRTSSLFCTYTQSIFCK